MAIEYKYGKITLEKGTIGENEPVVVFRAKDALLPEVLDAYYIHCYKSGSPEEHLNRIKETQKKIKHWQYNNETKIPD